MMNKLLIAACLTLPLAAFAADEKKPTAQQQRMATCNKEAGSKKLEGDARKAFMKECLSADHKGASAAKTAQQDKMVACNKQAGEKNLKGTERKTFMSSCLKG
jgi:psiF repeat